MSSKKQSGRFSLPDRKKRQAKSKELLQEKLKGKPAGFSTAESLLNFPFGWEGDDLEECMEETRRVRGKVRF
jgi:hypothetical protein